MYLPLVPKKDLLKGHVAYLLPLIQNMPSYMVEIARHMVNLTITTRGCAMRGYYAYGSFHRVG